ncbi:MAG TPA: UvrD-helicase domain-containing protein [Symbiobacteriaceae bacterium]|nr:UvrD-helicase domain-containing protein [Symbiobacteriaceae bacterium]
MSATMILGPTGAGKTTALMRRYYELVRGGARTDQVLVLTAGAAHTTIWRRSIKLDAHGPIEAHSFFGFIQRELNLYWAPVQGAIPALKKWVRPEFLNVEIAHHLMRALVEPVEVDFSHLVKASPQRIAIQIASNLSTVASASGLTPGEMARRLARADRHEKDRTRLYDLIHGLLEVFREQCLLAGVLDYGLSLHLFTGVLMQDPNYLEHLRGRYRFLLVDDLDETVPAEQDFLAAVAGQMEQTMYAFGTDGGHSSFMGADPASAMQRFGPQAQKTELTGSHTCSAEAFAFGEALKQRIGGQRPGRRFTDIVEEHLTADLRGDMVDRVVAKVAQLVDRGVPPGEIAVITPHVDKALEVTARRALEPRGIPVQNLSLSRRLVDEPYARAIITLAGLVHPHWRIPRDSAGSFSNAMQLLLRLDPIRASILGDTVWRAGDLPDLDEAGLRRRVGFERSEAYEYLRTWVHEARRKEWGTDEFAQAVVAEVMAPLVGDLTPQKLHACQQLLTSAHRFRQAMERFGDEAYGSEYIKMLTEGTVAAEPLEAYDPARDAVTLATPFAYLTTRLTSQYQIWVDISSDGWYPSDVKELANPHVLSRRWEEGNQWNDRLNKKQRQANAARTAQALMRRCRGRVVLAECGLTAWGMEQEGGLAEAFGDLIREKKGTER